MPGPSHRLSTIESWGKEERVSHPICVDCAIQSTPDPESRDHYACDSCGIVVDAFAALTRFRVELGHLEAHSSSVRGVVRVGRRRTGRVTSGPISSWTNAPSSRRHEWNGATVGVSLTYPLPSAALFGCLSRCSAIFNSRALLGMTMDCPACGAPLTLEVGPEQPLSTSLRDAVLAADTDECLEITRACWDCGWQEVRQVRVESITTAGDEAAVERATLPDEINDELTGIESVDTLEEALATIRRHRDTEPATTDTNDTTE